MHLNSHFQAPHNERGEELLSDRSAITISQFSMVDLAGSERNNRTKATGDRIKEAGMILQNYYFLKIFFLFLISMMDLISKCFSFFFGMFFH